MKKGLHIGAGPVHLDSDQYVEWENSDGAALSDTESSRSWTIEKVRDFTQPFDDILDNTIDCIVFWHCVEHLGLSEKDPVLKEFLRMLKFGGKLYIACPDVSKIARHIVDRDGPWQDWFICMVNIFGPYNGYIGDFHRWGYNEEELKRLVISLGFSQANTLSPQTLYQDIGMNNGAKMGFADYNIQLEVIK